MTRAGRCIALALAAATITLQACAKTEEPAASIEAPATLEEVAGADVRRVTLTAKAAERLDIQTVELIEEAVTSGAVRKVVPYSAVIYDPAGRTWVYVSAGLSFLREPIGVADIVDDRALLSSGPTPGTRVVTVGAAELFGTETEVGH